MITPAAYGLRSSKIKVVESKIGKLEVALLALISLSRVLLAILAMETPLFAFADYRLRRTSFARGALAMAIYA